jgi:hypothetical protein
MESKGYTRTKLPVRANKFLARSIEKITTNHLNPRTDINFVRYADDIIFFGFHNADIFEKVRIKVKSFLKYRGLNIKGNTDNIFLFKPGSKFTYLSYQVIFPSRFNRRKINFGKFTKVKYSP